VKFIKRKIKPEKEIKIKPSLTFLKNKAKTLEDIFNNAKYIILDEVKFDDQDLKLIDDKAKKIIAEFKNKLSSTR
jgi:glutamyl-tRNA synthetase